MSKIYQKHIPDVKTSVKRRFGGFTLIELLVVVLIIGILAAIVVPQYKKAVLKARIARVLPQLKAIQEAQERFYMANGHYTTEKDDLDIDWEREGLEPHSSFDMNTYKVWYTGAGPGIHRCYEHPSETDASCRPEAVHGKFVCNGYGSDRNTEICRSFSTDTVYTWTPHFTYW